MNKVILIIILSLLCHVTMAVDVDKETFNSLTYANGLAGETVRNMDVDHHGQIWMATGQD